MKKGFTLIELLVVILISALIIGAVIGLYIAHQRLQAPAKATSDIMEIQRAGLAQLEWIFSRWGTGTPCNDPTGANICTRIRPCDINGNFGYPPPSTLCVSIRSGNPCSEVYFYANFEGIGIVNSIYRNEVRLLSCRLETEDNNNCFHILRHGRFLRNANNTDEVLIFGLQNLDNQRAECLDSQYTNPANYNAQCSRNATIYNGFIMNQAGEFQNWLLLEGGDVIVRVPKRVHLYCENGPDNRLWLKMDLTDMAEMCNQDEPALNISPVENFHATLIVGEEEIDDTFLRNNPSSANYLNATSGAIRIEVTFRNFEAQNSPNYRTISVERIFGR